MANRKYLNSKLGIAAKNVNKRRLHSRDRNPHCSTIAEVPSSPAHSPAVYSGFVYIFTFHVLVCDHSVDCSAIIAQCGKRFLLISELAHVWPISSYRFRRFDELDWGVRLKSSIGEFD